MTTWILIVYIATDLWIPLPVSFPSEKECYEYIDKMELAAGVRATCLPGVIEKEKQKSRHR